MLEPEPRLEPEDPKLEPEVLAALVPLPELPRSAGKRVWPKGSRTGRGIIWEKSITRTRMPNSISRERVSDSSVRYAEIRAAR
jgi:hypothetical protein